MTNFSKPSRKISFLFLIFTAFLSACARPPSQRNSSVESSHAMTGVIGGTQVPETADYAQKVLYLAMGVRMIKDARGFTRVTWGGHCTASAISKRVILTAAHCVENQRPDQLKIVLTQNPSTTPLRPNEWMTVIKYQAHELYRGQQTGFANDLALILVDRDLPESRVLKLASKDVIQTPFDFMIVGYGTSSALSDPRETAAHSEIMNSVLKVVEDFNPNAATFGINQNDHKGFCAGDSGGPGLLYDPESHEYYIVGVVSNVAMMDMERRRLDPEGKYSLCIGQGNYTSVVQAQHRQWIESTYLKLTAASL